MDDTPDINTKVLEKYIIKWDVTTNLDQIKIFDHYEFFKTYSLDFLKTIIVSDKNVVVYYPQDEKLYFPILQRVYYCTRPITYYDLLYGVYVFYNEYTPLDLAIYYKIFIKIKRGYLLNTHVLFNGFYQISEDQETVHLKLALTK